jgi:hypothetical protein
MPKASSWRCWIDNPSKNEKDQYSLGIEKLLKMFIDWAPLEHEDEDGFVLSHPDFDIQNLLVTPEGKLCGMIDWDGVAAAPRCIGNRCFPGWLTRDWDPAMYAWEAKGDAKENSPDELDHYRNVYADIMTKHGFDARLTRNSLILENLYIAASDPICQHGIVGKVFDEIARLIVPETMEDDGSPQGQDGRPSGMANEVANDDVGAREYEDENGDVHLQDHDNEDHENREDDNNDIKHEGEQQDDDRVWSPVLGTEFYLYEVAMALASNSLDLHRLAMLKEGFLRLFD